MTTATDTTPVGIEIISKYFPHLTERQQEQFAALDALYHDWNSKINVISRKDIDNLYLHHVLHSLGLAKVITFRPETTVMDVGTGGGFPGIPLAILFPEVRFHLVDSIGKKIKVATDVAQHLGLDNVSLRHCNVMEEKQQFDFVVSRAVMNTDELVRLVRARIKKRQQNSLPNGLLCLKGGELGAELQHFKHVSMTWDLSDFFEEDFFATKKVIYVSIS